VLFVLVALLAVIPVAATYGHTYFFYDEWSMINRVATGGSPLSAAFASFNGHLWFFPYFVYRIQVNWFGLTGHAFVFAVFCASLVGLTLAVSLLLRELGVPTILALAAGILVTYFGAGSQSMVFEVQLSWNFAGCFALLAALVTVSSSASWKGALAAAGLLLIAAGWDSAQALLIGLVPLVFAGWRWRRASLLVPLVAVEVATAVWSLLPANAGPRFPPGSAADAAAFAGRLVLSGFVGLTGGGNAIGAARPFTSPLAVALASVAAAAVLGVVGGGLVHRRLNSTQVLALVAGLLALAAMVALTTWSRAGLVKGDLRDYNRYVQVVAMLLVLALLPPVVRPRLAAIGVALAALVFTLNLGAAASYRRGFESWSTETRRIVAESVTVLNQGCPRRHPARPQAQPAGALDPQITVALLQRLRTGRVALPTHTPADLRLWAAVCASAAARA